MRSRCLAPLTSEYCPQGPDLCTKVWAGADFHSGRLLGSVGVDILTAWVNPWDQFDPIWYSNLGLCEGSLLLSPERHGVGGWGNLGKKTIRVSFSARARFQYGCVLKKVL